MKKNIILPVITLIFGISLIACNPAETLEIKPASKVNSPKKPTADQLRTELTQLKIDIDSTIGLASCTNSKQCGAIAIGHKACGGPSGYLPYSTADTDTTKLFELSTQHQQSNKTLNQLTGMMSDCSVVSAPIVSCIENRCQVSSKNSVSIPR